MKKLIVSLLALGLSVTAFASGDQGRRERQLTFEQFKQSCLNPGQFHNQRPPRNIKIICTDYKRVWELADSRASRRVDGYRRIGTKLISDKYQVNGRYHEVGMGATTYSCPILKEVEKVISTEKAVTCDDLTNFKGDLRDYCLDHLDVTIADNSDLVEIRETGRVLNACKGSAGQQGRGNQGGQR